MDQSQFQMGKSIMNKMLSTVYRLCQYHQFEMHYPKMSILIQWHRSHSNHTNKINYADKPTGID